jgi:hypothetical protein
MKCPNCGLTCPPESRQCDCGYDFVAGFVRRPLLPAEPQSLGYSPLAKSAKWARWLLFVVAAFCFLDIVLWPLQATLLERAAGSMPVAQDRAASILALLLAIMLVVMLIAFIASGITFLVWFDNARCNLPHLGAEHLKYKRGWAVGGFFVPFLNLVRPLQVMREIWHASDPEEKWFPTPIQMQARRQITPPLVGWWWALCLLSGCLGWIEFKLIKQQGASWISIAGDIVRMAGAFVAASLIKTVTERQAKRHRARSQRSPQLQDAYKNAPAEELNGSEPTKNCPQCGASYRESDYRPDAAEWLCSQCRAALPPRGALR